jgi:amidase
VIPIKLPFNCWQVALTTWKLYFQTGAAEIKAVLAAGCEQMLPSLQYHLKAFAVKPLSASEVFELNRRQLAYKFAMSDFWTATASATTSGLPIDAIIAPVHPSASYPHDFPSWWGYTSLWNILDYPSTTIPVKEFKISAETDPKDLSYTPIENAFDKATYDMCK